MTIANLLERMTAIPDQSCENTFITTGDAIKTPEGAILKGTWKAFLNQFPDNSGEKELPTTNSTES